jgi:Beta-propeller domains of methanol dehydrogenase type
MRRRDRSHDTLRALVAAQVSVPRLQMSLLVLLTAATGFLASVVLSAIGMDALWLRYPICVLLAYGTFLGLIWAWRRHREWDLSGLPSGDGASPSSSSGKHDWQGGGGSSGGGGASASFDAPAMHASSASFGPIPTSAELPSLDNTLDADEALPVVFVMVLLGGALLAVGWVIWIAPTLLAELALDAVLSAGLYRRLKRPSTDDHWISTTLRHTGKPFVAATLSLLVAGALMNLLVPDATSLGEFLAHFQ